MSALRGVGRQRAAIWPERALVPMATAHLDAVMAIEVAAYDFPWSRGNFVDSLAAGHSASVLLGVGGRMLGYVVAMAGVDEVHLLNITVAPDHQGRGHARFLIGALIVRCRERGARKLWLEVRGTNAHARAVYERLGFQRIGIRKGYYPAAFGRREDALVMNLSLDTELGEVRDGLE